MVGELRPITELPWDPSFLSLTDDEEKFFKLWTGITDEKELREHIIDVAARAYKVSEFPNSGQIRTAEFSNGAYY
jgi:hypothetical protein